MQGKERLKQPVPDQLSEFFYALFFVNSEEAIMILSQAGEILAANAAAGDILDYPARDLQKMHIKDLFVDPQQCEKFFDDLQNEGRVNRQLAMLKKRQGATCRGLISLRSGPGDSERPSLLMATFSLKTRSESLLQKERNFISAILETTGALVVLLDPQFRFMRINNSFERLTGYSIFDVLGNYIWDAILPAGEVQKFKDVLIKIARNQPPLEHRCLITGSDGREYTVIWNITVMSGEENQPEYLICTGIDVTELQAALSKIKTLSGFLPICSYCKKIRNDRGYWDVLEDYIRKNSDAEFSHSLCPECSKIHYPEIFGK